MIGPVMLDIAGVQLTDSERARLRHPLLGGLVLFSRNFESPEQLEALTAELHARHPDLLIAVDHEGGRVQRFLAGFTALPPMGAIGARYAGEPALAERWAEATGFVLAWELRARGVDLSFTPVLDLDYGTSAIIGNRAFHRDPRVVARLALALRQGLQAAGFSAVGKHFPGHGHVAADSHLDLPVDDRAFAALEADDLVPFKTLVEAGLEGIMPAHILYPAMDDQPAGFSRFWLQQVLRTRLGFQGAIFSDDLSMQGAMGAGTPAQRAQAAFAAGCDMVLLCNDPPAAEALLDGLRDLNPSTAGQGRLARLRPRPPGDPAALQARYARERDFLEAHA